MRSNSLAGLVALGTVVIIATAASAQQNTQPAASGAAPRVEAKPKADDPRLKETVGTVNGEPITKRDLVNLLVEFQIPPSGEERAYEAAMELLVNTKLLEQFLQRANVPTPAQEVQNVVNQYRKELEDQGTSLTNVLAQTSTTEQEFQERIARSLQWKKFVTDRATDAVLKKYVQDNTDVFRGTQVRASHILVKVDPDADDEAKAKARQKIEAIKKEIDSGAISFADAANKYSEDEGNAEAKKGGDLGYFPRKGQLIEEFASVAFANKDKTGVVLGPVETEYGLHLIEVTDVREGQPLEPDQFLAQFKDAVLNQYAAELQTQIVEAERAKAEQAGQIKTDPMPDDLFGLIPAEEPPAPATDTPQPAEATTPPATGAAPKADR